MRGDAAEWRRSLVCGSSCSSADAPAAAADVVVVVAAAADAIIIAACLAAGESVPAPEAMAYPFRFDGCVMAAVAFPVVQLPALLPPPAAPPADAHAAADSEAAAPPPDTSSGALAHSMYWTLLGCGGTGGSRRKSKSRRYSCGGCSGLWTTDAKKQWRSLLGVENCCALVAFSF